MPSFNTFVKLKSVKNTDLSGSPRNKLRQLAASANGIASIADEFLREDPNSRSLANSSVNTRNTATGFDENSDILYFPTALASQEYPAWVQISMYKRETLAKQLDDVKIDRSVGEPTITGFVKSTLTDLKNAGKEYAKALENYNYDGSRMDLIGLFGLPLQSGMGVNNTGVEIAAEEIGSSLGQIVKNGVGVAGGDLKGFFGEQLKNQVISAPVIGNALQLSTGRVMNPYSFQLFKGVKHRAFNFTFNLVPTSEFDSFSIKEIIRKMEDGMLPDNNGFTFSYPYEFKIEYFYMDENNQVRENTFYPKTGFCYLNNISESPNDQTSSIHRTGAPVSIQIQMDFSEIEPMDRQKHKILNQPRR